MFIHINYNRVTPKTEQNKVLQALLINEIMLKKIGRQCKSFHHRILQKTSFRGFFFEKAL